ncbi:hypothetical protein AB4Z40_10530 [Bosea sp. 2YAB26]|uniref:hypothetical protein n=1 Tax=Bosea sp. 2YAB26 TaxID=3237478 RepID=UPI003F91D531
MVDKIIKIERTSPRDGVSEEPELTPKGYCLGDPRFSSQKHLAKNAVYVKTLDEVGELLVKGFSLRMTAKGKRSSLVAAKYLIIVRA